MARGNPNDPNVRNNSRGGNSFMNQQQPAPAPAPAPASAPAAQASAPAPGQAPVPQKPQLDASRAAFDANYRQQFAQELAAYQAAAEQQRIEREAQMTPPYAPAAGTNPNNVNPGVTPTAQRDKYGFRQDVMSWTLGRDPNYVAQFSDRAQNYASQGAERQNAYAFGLQNYANQASEQGKAADRTLGQYGAAMYGYGQGVARDAMAQGQQLGDMGQYVFGQGGAAAGRAAPGMDLSGAQGALGSSMNNAQQLSTLESQQGPSAAQALLRQGQSQAMAQQLALARSGRGFGGSAQAMAEAQRANAATSMQASNQASMLRAQEDAAWRQRQAAALQAGGALQQGAAQQLAAQQGMLAQNELAARAQNDAAAAQLYGLGLDAQTQAGQQTLAAGQLGLAGMAGGAQAIGQGAQLGLAGTGTAGQMLSGASQASAASTNQNLQGLTLGFNAAQAQAQLDQAREANILQQYGIREGVGVANNQSNMQLIGGGIAAAGATIAATAPYWAPALASISDRRAKKDVRVEDAEAFLSPGDSLLREGVAVERRPSVSEAAAFLSPGDSLVVEPPLAQVPSAAAPPSPAPAYDYGYQYLVGGTPSAYGGPQRAPAAGPDAYPDNAYARSMAAAQRAQQAEALDPSRPRVRFMITSDERAKKDVEALETVREAPGYSYRYEDPARHGSGVNYGPMAQDLERTPAGRSVVREAPDGTKMVDTSRLSLVNTAALNAQQREIDELRSYVFGGGAPSTSPKALTYRRSSGGG